METALFILKSLEVRQLQLGQSVIDDILHIKTISYNKNVTSNAKKNLVFILL